MFDSEYVLKLAKLAAQTDVKETSSILKKMISRLDTYSFGTTGKTRNKVLLESSKLWSVLREIEKSNIGSGTHKKP